MQLDEIEEHLRKDSRKMLFLSGNPACGKTTVVTKLIAQHGFQYVNVALVSKPEQIFVQLFRQLTNTERVISAENAYKFLQDYKKRATVVVDEVDYLTRKGFDALYRLCALPFQLILVANSLSFVEEITAQRESSRLS